MQRIIKFRTWNSVINKYHFNTGYHPHLMMDLSKEDEFYNHETEGCWLYAPCGDMNVMEQFIGLHDKHGKEIYEGDIVNGLSYNGSYHYGKVIYSKNSFIVVPLGKLSEGTSEDFEQCEIIGNIHQNPELL